MKNKVRCQQSNTERAVGMTSMVSQNLFCCFLKLKEKQLNVQDFEANEDVIQVIRKKLEVCLHFLL